MKQVTLRSAAIGLGALLLVLVVSVGVVGFLSGPGQPPAQSPTAGGQAPTVSPPPEASPSNAASPLPTLSPEPSPSAPPSPSAEPRPTASPSLSPAASPGASPQPSPTPSAAPSASPTPSAPPQSVFVPVEGFPGPTELVTEIIGGGPGFVAVGFAESSTGGCPDFFDGRIWTSADGAEWTRRDGDSLPGVRLNHVVAMGGALYALGYSGAEECPLPDDYGNNVWRSSDGLAWEQLTSGVGSPDDRWADVTAASDRLVVVGALSWSDPQVTEVAGVWTSADGATWQAAGRPPRTHMIERVAALGNKVVGLGSDPADGLAWYSADGGETWRRGNLDTGYLPYTFSLAAADGRFVAATTACCAVPYRTVAVSFTSSDGRTWQAGPGLERTLGDSELVLPVATGFLTFTDMVSSRLSGDGLNWSEGPPGPALHEEFGILFAAAVSADSVVLVTYDRLGDGFGTRGWVAPLSAFRPTDWTQPAQPAQRPVVGEPYDYRLYTHCGTEGMRVLLDGSVWIVERIESTGRGFRDPEDRGSLTMLSADELRFESRRGGSILFERASSPPPWPRCA